LYLKNFYHDSSVRIMTWLITLL